MFYQKLQQFSQKFNTMKASMGRRDFSTNGKNVGKIEDWQQRPDKIVSSGDLYFPGHSSIPVSTHIKSLAYYLPVIAIIGYCFNNYSQNHSVHNQQDAETNSRENDQQNNGPKPGHS